MTLFIQSSAEEDILRQFDWYAERGLPDIARRFYTATRQAINALALMPEAGVPRLIGNPRLDGLRSWPVDGFDAFRVYYLVQPERVTVVRILHGKRDIGSILESETLEDAGPH